MKNKTVTGIDLSFYLQLLSTDKENCLLLIKKDSHVGIIYICDGEPQDAQSKRQEKSGRQDVKHCEEALYEMLSWEEPTIEVHPLHQPVQQKIHKSLTYILIESCNRADEQQEKRKKNVSSVQEQTSSEPYDLNKLHPGVETHRDNKTTASIDILPQKDTSKPSDEQLDNTVLFPLIDEEEQEATQGGTQQKTRSAKSLTTGNKSILAAILVLVSGLTMAVYLFLNFQQKNDNLIPKKTESRLRASKEPSKTKKPVPLEKTAYSQVTTETSPAVITSKNQGQADNTKKAILEATPQDTTVLPKEGPKTHTAKNSTSAPTKQELETTILVDSPTKITHPKASQETVPTIQKEQKKTTHTQTTTADHTKKQTQETVPAIQKEQKKTTHTQTTTADHTKKQTQETVPTIQKEQKKTTHTQTTTADHTKKQTQETVAKTTTPKNAAAQKSADDASRLSKKTGPIKNQAPLPWQTTKKASSNISFNASAGVTAQSQNTAKTRTVSTIQKGQKKTTHTQTTTADHTKKQTQETVAKTTTPKKAVAQKSADDASRLSKKTGPVKNQAPLPWQTTKKASSNISFNANAGVTAQSQNTAKTSSNVQPSQRKESDNEINQAKEDISRAIGKYNNYPRTARRAGYGGVVKIKIIVNPNGQVTHCMLYETSGRKVLDAAAMRAAQSLLGKKVTSASLSQELSFLVPVRFSP
ncbi:MAG: hypothetical protein CSA33_00700 [Desulfobulbus propionicus]|nr:MAG: hypothetical protein CSA33_00700 [Desulfobulbus propionicus]